MHHHQSITHIGLPARHTLMQREVMCLKKGLMAIVGLFMIALLSGCSGDPVQEDILNYVNKELKDAAKFESAAITAYESVTGANFTDDQTLYDALTNEVMPNYEKLLKELDSIAIETDELKEIHDIYIDGAEIQYKAFTVILQAIEEQDDDLIEEANGMLTDAETLISDYQNKLDKLANEHDVDIKK